MVDWHLSLAIKPLQTNIWSFPITWQTQSGWTSYVAAGFSQSKCFNSQKVEAESLKAFAQKTGTVTSAIFYTAKQLPNPS